MVSLEEGVVGGLAALASLLYFWVARIQGRRRVSPEARPALVGFILWWAGLGVVGLFTSYFQFGPSLEEQTLPVVRSVFYALFGLIFVMLAGLVHYMLYLYTGRNAGLYVAAAFYTLMFLMTVWLIEAHAPHVAPMHEGERAGEVLFHLHEEPPAWAELGFSLGLLVPPLGAAVAYGLLFFRTTDRTARFRIALVSFGFILWFGFSLLGSVARAVAGESEQGFAARVTGQLLGVLAAVLVLIAYDPPRGLRRRFGLRSIDEPVNVTRELFESPRRVQPSQRAPFGGA